MKKVIYILVGLFFAIIFLSGGGFQKAKADFGNWESLPDTYDCFNYSMIADQLDELSYDALVLGEDIEFTLKGIDKAKAKAQRRKIIKEINTLAPLHDNWERLCLYGSVKPNDLRSSG